MSIVKAFPKLSPEEAVVEIFNGATVAFSGFTNSGAAKAVPRAIAAKAHALHGRGEPFKIRVLTGASSGESIDEPLAEAEAMSYRAPYQSGPKLRGQINRQEVEYVDMHLSHLPQTVLAGFQGKLDFAVVEATEVTPDGRVYLTSSIGASPTYLRVADRVILEVNRYHSRRLREMSDILLLPPVPHRTPIRLNDPLTKIGYPYAIVDPKKVIGIIETDEPDRVPSFAAVDARSERIAQHVLDFLLREMHKGRIPAEFLPLQAGVGNVANGVMAALGSSPEIPPFSMYTEVYQDSLVGLMEQGKLLGASTTSLTVTPEVLMQIYDNMDFFVPRIVLRPQELSNHPGAVRRLGVISMNTALEVDIYGNVNSSHVYGMDIMNGIGGSGEFTRNSYLSIFMCPSIAKGGKISAVVPMCPHIDNNEHSVQIIATDQGLADLRGLGPMQRAQTIIENCAHPAYRDYLHRYVERARVGHIRHDLRTAFELHRNLLKHGAMLPDLDLSGVA
ncbi:succinate CoA transferase [Desulforhabdus sp. TSK]|uniref:succinate CoA transferase n=1 Tax=Desulforhabdus sp. TSK TaxID=2925014 RepID=UPI001FC89B05|nr:succinate CoA transferase [Desulforhabdus sp. TSK]GKT10636.1 acetyl-CoA hydrolase [Desulforhabdus sp. TSK]